MSRRFTVAHLIVSGERFEIMVNPDAALEYKMGKPVGLSKVLVYEAIFKDVGKGEKASEDKLKHLLGTNDPLEAGRIILTKGELQLTTEQRRKMTDEKRKQIVDFISRQCLDPRTGLPHPPLRIEQAMEEVRINIDPFENAEKQALTIIESLKPILPIKMELVSIEVRVPPQYASKAYGALKSYGTITREQWQSDGSLMAFIQMPAGLQGPFMEKLGNITRGAVQAKVVR